MTDITLLPCPFCGGTNTRIDIGLVEFVDGEVTCQDCGGNVGNHPSREEAIAGWNRRASPSQRPAVDVVEARPDWSGWRSIDTAPEDCRVILATAGNWVGEAIMLRDEDTGEQVWTWVDTGKPSLFSCYGWKPLALTSCASPVNDAILRYALTGGRLTP